jgi:large subunit ribosomal protein L4
MYRGAMQAILSELVRQDRLKVVPALDIAAAKTKSFVAKMNELGVSRATFVADEVSENAYLAARNLPHVYGVWNGRCSGSRRHCGAYRRCGQED